MASLGENAAAQTGSSGAALANSAAQSTIAGGQAQAAGAAGVGNAISGGVNSYLGYNALQSAINGGGNGFSNVGADTLNSLSSHSAISGYSPY